MARRIFDSDNGNEINKKVNIQNNNENLKTNDLLKKMEELKKDKKFINVLKELSKPSRVHYPTITTYEKSVDELKIEKMYEELKNNLETLKKHL